MKLENYEQYESYTAQKLRFRLSNHYGDKIRITEEVNRSIFIYSSEVRIVDMINIAQSYKQMIKDKELSETETRKREEKILERAAVLLVEELAETDSISIDPQVPEDVGEKKMEEIVSCKLKHFLDKLCKSSSDDSSKKKILSIAQDIINVSSNGRKLMPKHVALRITLKNSLQSKEFISYLNQLGHCVSYDTISRIETRWAETILSENDITRIIVNSPIPTLLS